MNDTVQRLKLYIDYKGISIRKFEDSVGFSNGAFSTQYKRNKTIGVDKVEKIVNAYPDINPEWLLTGAGEMIRNVGEHPVYLSNQDDLAEPELSYAERPNYREKYIEELELQIRLLREDLKTKQDLIDNFLSGCIIKRK